MMRVAHRHRMMGVERYPLQGCTHNLAFHGPSCPLRAERLTEEHFFRLIRKLNRSRRATVRYRVFGRSITAESKDTRTTPMHGHADARTRRIRDTRTSIPCARARDPESKRPVAESKAYYDESTPRLAALSIDLDPFYARVGWVSSDFNQVKKPSSELQGLNGCSTTFHGIKSSADMKAK